MGEILLAYKKGIAGFEKFVVVKRLLPHLLDDESFVAMFITEARVAARITHPNVCQVYDLGQVDGQYYIAMEYLQGLPLSTILRDTVARRRLLDPRLVAGIIVQVCEGLHHAHELVGVDGKNLGLVHRDLTPSNLFVTLNGVVKILDFGIAKVQGAIAKTRTGTIKGKYSYMSPEQLAGEKLDRRSDLFTLGIVMWEAMTCRRLFKRDAEYKTFKAITEDRIPRVDESRTSISSAIADVVTRALLRDRRMRFATARDLADPLRDAVAELGGPLSPTSIAEVLKKDYVDALADQIKMRKDARRAAGLDSTASSPVVSSSAKDSTVRQSHTPAARSPQFPGPTGTPGASSHPPTPTAQSELEKTTLYAPSYSKEPAAGKRKVKQAAAKTVSVRSIPGRGKLFLHVTLFVGLVAAFAIGGTLLFRVWQKGPQDSLGKFQLAANQLRVESSNCLKDAPDEAQGLAVTFHLDHDGVVSRVGFSTRKFAATAAGKCIKSAVQRLNFGPQSDAQNWKFPLR